MRTCPKCALLNPDSAVMCAGGHPFDGAAAETARAGGFSPQDEIRPPGPTGAAKFGAGLLGYFVGALVIGFPLESQVAMGSLDSSVAGVVSMLSGIVGIFVSLRLQKKRHESRRR